MSSKKDGTVFSELYSGYAAGCLDPAFALLVETQAALRADIADQVALSELVSGLLLESAPPLQMKATALQAALDEIDRLGPALASPHRIAERVGEDIAELLALPEPLREKALNATEIRGWSFAGPGLKRLQIDTDGQAETELFRISPGASVPRHTHEGVELTLVVTGGFSDASGQFGPGDVAVKTPDDTHQPVADPGEVCIALAVRDGGLRFTGAMGFVQRLLGR